MGERAAAGNTRNSHHANRGQRRRRRDNARGFAVDDGQTTRLTRLVDADQSTELSRAACMRILGRSAKPMPNEITACLRRFLGKSGERHGVHAPFRVTTHRGHTVQTFESLELALQAAEGLGPDAIWNPQRKLLRSEE
jgi:hypothetical protein